MFQWFSISTPANTAVTNPKETVIKIDTGIINEWKVEIPSGHAGLTGFQVHDKNVSIFPRSRDEWISGDNTKFEVLDEYEVRKESCRLIAKTYNEDTKFAHAVKIGINVIKQHEELLLSEINKNLIKIKQLLGGSD